MKLLSLVRGSFALMIVSVCASAVNYTNPVIPGDNPDPSIIRVGQDYYVTDTTSEWAPVFPILHSKDLVNWQTIGAVFKQTPGWAVGSYWAPEITAYNDKYFVYYVARKRNGPLSVAVATADQPAGPYTDHGPFISQDAGSIDPAVAQDENGRRYLIWKEDGNSRRQPTILWIQRLAEDGLGVEGERKEILRNDLPWEGDVVEGPFVIRKNGYFYLFYAANACCGSACHYGVGVARAKNLLGPWEKHEEAPLVQENAIWKCPGHGSAVQLPNGDYYFIYHAYEAKDSVFVGRQAVLAKIDWDVEGWPQINGGQGTPINAPSPSGQPSRHQQYHFADDFKGRHLNPNWQWPQKVPPVYDLSDAGTLLLKPNPDQGSDITGGVLAVKTASGEYQATTSLRRPGEDQAVAGLCAFGDMANALGISVNGSSVRIWRKGSKKLETLAEQSLPAGAQVHLRMKASEGHRFTFAFSMDGSNWTELGHPSEGQYLPPWDRGIRIALVAGGSNTSGAKFTSFNVDFKPPQFMN
jgi:beta-xylosidase